MVGLTSCDSTDSLDMEARRARTTGPSKMKASKSSMLLNNNEALTNGAFKFKTKIVCTLGPSSRDLETLKKLLRAGMNVARFNFSHGSHEYHQETLDNLRTACKATNIFCAVLLDTKGPEIRTGLLENGQPVMLTQGDIVTLDTDYTKHGNAKLITCSYPKLAQDVVPGSNILAADGSITLKVLSSDVQNGTVQCRCENNAKLGEKKNMNLPGVIVDLPTITEKDQDDLINWGVKNNVDFLAPSFVRKGSDVTSIRKVLGEAGKDIKIISKVENNEGLDNFEDILAESDGIMVARGDLGMEIPMEKMFMVQKRMIERCNVVGKPVITATQMLESMTMNPRPTRAEATDVANAVLDGTDCVMLSGETAAGPYPVEAVKVMASVCEEAEAFVDYEASFQNILKQTTIPMTVKESLASSAVRAAQKVCAKVIIVLSTTGHTARLVAKYKPCMPVLAVCVSPDGTEAGLLDAQRVARQSLNQRSLVPLVGPIMTGPMKLKAQMSDAMAYAKKVGLVQNGDLVVGLHKVEEDAIMKIMCVQPEQ
eukprot:CAMPEP_0118920992 /NCGR_PEP_ID=MMETSP1169-20130426/403_1 /TAXON_ID=36882 /ORGANISM="Pyramimonas obovata, Strain CCMP722" /LENGTH=538 /DNA_ID=CAMNT_0006861637 /DNA_START=203 /DNA_END=1819 /DNA_ORIENTATION=-